MRLICPNCDAQYEVPDDVMPVSGRDVQCSNCGQTWFQHHPDHMPDDETEAQDHPAPDEETAPPPPPPPPAPPAPARKQLDPAVADILRQEAEAEQEARRKASTSGGLESQPDLGIDFAEPEPEDAAERRAREARDRMARLRGDQDAENVQAPRAAAPDLAAAAVGSRRDLLPDIEEINSTLRSGSARTGSGATDVGPEIEAPSHQRAKRGFRVGFLTVVMIFAVLALLYVIAPQLGESVPALKPLLDSYVMMIDQLRLWLDSTIQGLLKSLDSVAEDSGTS